jgi:hypothetical protein
VGKSEGKIALGRPRRRRVDNIKMDLREREYKGLDWINLTQDRDKSRVILNTVIILWFHIILRNFQVAGQLVAS